MLRADCRCESCESKCRFAKAKRKSKRHESKRRFKNHSFCDDATINGIVNAVYEQGKAEELIPKWVQAGEYADIAIIDPPRAGCRPELLEAIAAAEIPYIVYVSCDPATLARDIRLLKEGFAGDAKAEPAEKSDPAEKSGAGAVYELAAVTPVDMFPHTSHVETCCLLRRQA